VTTWHDGDDNAGIGTEPMIVWKASKAPIEVLWMVLKLLLEVGRDSGRAEVEFPEGCDGWSCVETKMRWIR